MPENININHLANLARLSLSDSKHDEAQEQLLDIMTMIDQMQAICTQDILPMAHPWDATQRLRQDIVTEPLASASSQEIAPEAANGYYLVPRVVE